MSANLPTNKIKHKRKYAFNNNFSIFFSGVALIIAIGAALISYLQLNNAKDTAQRQLRAYLGINMENGGLSIQPDGKLYIDYKIVNYGQTPAKEAKVRGSIKILPLNLTSTSMPDYRPIMLPEPNFILNPHSSIVASIKSVDSFDHDEIKTAVAFRSNKRIHLFLEITYLDAFDIERHSFGCFYYIPINFSASKDSVRYNWNVTEKYNSWN